VAKPVLLTVDDDHEVLRTLERDLQREYSEHYRVLGVDSAAVAMETLQQIQRRNEPVGLLLVDQQLPQTTGVEFLEKTIELFPEAKRVLMTAYQETDHAIRAINSAKIHYYLQKPWEPPEEHLYPILNDLLETWRSSLQPPFEGIRVIGARWSRQSHEIKDFLSLNQVPYQWLDIETSQEANYLVNNADLDAPQLPLVFFPNGSYFQKPKNSEIAEKVGLNMRPEGQFYDLIIVGAGAAGLAASVYGASEGLRTLMIERRAPGGQVGTTSRIENYMGFPMGLSGSELIERALTQAKRFGVEILTPQEVVGIRSAEPCRIVKLKNGNEIISHAVLITTGVEWRQLNAPGIDKLTGAGIYYGAALTEARACRDEDVYIVGGGNSAGQAAMYLSKYARQVTLLVRGDSLAKSMSQYLINEISATKNIMVWTHSTVVEVQGEEKLEAITIANSETSEKQTVPATSLFILIGGVPRTDWLNGVLERDEQGFILTGVDVMHKGSFQPRGWTLKRNPFVLESSVPGIFVAGDVRHGSVKRVGCATGEGSVAIHCIHQYLSQL
jgi:thioredoxin reductase (NADPH)